jgi:hypothetical protein
MSKGQGRSLTGNQWIALAGVIVALIAAIPAYLALRDNGTPTPPTEPPRAAIVSPRKGQRVPVETEVRGTSENLGPGQQIWIIVLPSNSIRYFPENPAPVEANGNWAVKVRLGGDEHKGLAFDILAVITLTNDAKKSLVDYNKCRQTEECPGLEILPDGVQVSHRIRVTRT